MKKKYLTLEQVCSEIQEYIDRGNDIKVEYECNGHWYVYLNIRSGGINLSGAYICCDEENSCGQNDYMQCDTVEELRDFFEMIDSGWQKSCE